MARKKIKKNNKSKTVPVYSALNEKKGQKLF